MSSRKQRLDVGPSSSTSSEQNKPRKRRFDDAPETDPFGNAGKTSRDMNPVPQTNPSINRFTMKNYSHQYFEIFKKRRQLPVWDYKDAFMATLEKNQVSARVRRIREMAMLYGKRSSLGHCPRR